MNIQYLPGILMPMVVVQEQSRLQTLKFRALGTEALVYSPVAAALAGEIRAMVEDYEARFSRFRPESEVNRLSSLAGQETPISAAMLDVLVLCKAFHEQSGGLFDPLIRPFLEFEGYDRTFQDVPRTAPPPPERTAPQELRSFGKVELDCERQTVRLPEGASLDLGGVAKGWIIDRLAAFLAPHGPYLIDIGGDIRTGGRPPEGETWLVAVADPIRISDDVCWIHLRDEALATSTTMRRRWTRGGVWRHHLIDPRTGRSSTTDVVQASVIAAGAAQADVYAKTALLLGSGGGSEWLRRRRLPGLLLTAGGDALRTANWPQREQPVER